MTNQIHPLGKMKVLERRALEAYRAGDFVTFAATFDYFGLSHPDADSLDIGRADPSYQNRVWDIDLKYASGLNTGAVRIKPLGFNPLR